MSGLQDGCWNFHNSSQKGNGLFDLRMGMSFFIQEHRSAHVRCPVVVGKILISNLGQLIFCQPRIEPIKMNHSSQNPNTPAPNSHPTPDRVESFEELIEISQSPQESLVARVSDQVLHKHSVLQAEHKTFRLDLKFWKVGYK